MPESRIEDLNPEQLRAATGRFRDSILAATSATTSNHALKLVKMLMRSARLGGYLFVDPAEAVKPAKNEALPQRRAFTLDELRAVLELADDEWHSLIMFGLHTGQRLADIASLTWAQIDLAREQIRFLPRKTGKPLLIPLATPLRDHILSLPASDNPQTPLHPKAHAILSAKGRTMRLSSQFASLLAAAGLRKPQPHQSRGIGRAARREQHALSFHSLRHTAVTLLKDSGIPDAVIMALVGHQSAAMSQKYTHVGIDALQKAVSSLPQL